MKKFATIAVVISFVSMSLQDQTLLPIKYANLGLQNTSPIYSQVLQGIQAVSSSRLAANRKSKGLKYSEFEFESWFVGSGPEADRYVPKDPKAFLIEIYKPKSSRTTTNLQSKMNVDMRRVNVTKIVKMRQVQNFNLYTAALNYKDRKGASRYYMYLVFPHKTGSQVVRISYATRRLMKRYSGVTKTIHRKLMQPKFYAANLNKQKKVEQAKLDKERKEEELKLARWTKPNQGVPLRKIEAVVQNIKTIVNGYGNAYGDYTNYLLLKDGSVYIKLTIPPSDFNVKVSRSMEPQRWSRWKRNWSGGYQFKNKKTGRWEDIKGAIVKPAGKNTRLQVNLSHLKVTGNVFYGGGQSRKFINLRRNGRFESSRSTVLASGMAAQNIASSAAWSKQDKHGKSSGASGHGKGAVLSTRSRSRQGAKDHVGRYSINGYTIEFRTDSGVISRQLFFYDGNYINIGDINFKRN